jgi:hypothetical protein
MTPRSEQHYRVVYAGLAEVECGAALAATIGLARLNQLGQMLAAASAT